MTKNDSENTEVEYATFAGGCFWCVEEAFVETSGVLTVTSGYTGGHTRHPTYEQVIKGDTGHAEAVQLAFTPQSITYEKLLEVFWHNIDPTNENGQFCDIGNQYRPAIFYHDERQQQQAITSKQALEGSKPFPAPIAVEIMPLIEFYPAEDYHQGFHHKNPTHYQRYRQGSGRDQRLKELWSEDE